MNWREIGCDGPGICTFCDTKRAELAEELGNPTPWYGNPNVEFVFVDPWNDPLIFLLSETGSKTDHDHGFVRRSQGVPAHVVENTMWERFLEDNPDGNEDEFALYMARNDEEVCELIEIALYPERG